MAGLEQDVRQSRLTMKADVQAKIKTRECTEGAATAVQAMYWDSFSPNQVVPVPKTTSTNFSVKAELPSLSCRDDGLVENSATAPKSRLSPLEMRTTTAVAGLLPTGKTTTATWTT